MEVYNSSRTAAELEYALGAVPSIGENGNWWIGNQDTGVFAKGINVTGAEVGQTVKIAAVDENGVPTAWEAADLVGGFEVIGDITTTETVQTVEFPYDNQNCSEIVVLVVPSASFKPSNGWFKLHTEDGELALAFAHINVITIGTVGAFSVTKIIENKAFSTFHLMGDYMWNSTNQYSCHYDRTRQGFTKIGLYFNVDVPVGTVIKVFAR